MLCKVIRSTVLSNNFQRKSSEPRVTHHGGGKQSRDVADAGLPALLYPCC